MERFYENIGGKLKNLAFWTFIVEAFATIITGIVLMGDEIFFPGLLTAILGPVMAWISSWMLYAFGELVEKTVENERNTHAILTLMQKRSFSAAPKTEAMPSVPKTEAAPAVQEPEPIPSEPAVQAPVQPKETTMPDLTADGNSWICSKCGRKNLVFRDTCWACGTESPK